MPFSFKLMIEFFLPGIIILNSFFLVVDLQITNILELFNKNSITLQIFFISLYILLCYFLGIIINGCSNLFIRKWITKFRIVMIKRKLNLKNDERIDKLDKKKEQIILEVFPEITLTNNEDKFKEIYAAARTFSEISSDRSGKIMDYHRSLVRLSRATILPLGILFFIFLFRWLFFSHSSIDFVGFISTLFVFWFTVINYRYREKFLIYTTFDIFFLMVKNFKNK